MLAIYRWFVTSPAGRASFGTALRRIVDASGPLLYHCSAGKDRTGVGTAILLTILGVPRETVVNDFLLSNTYRGPGSVQREWLEGWFDSVNAAWGSFGNYVKYGLQLDDATVARLKAKFLTTP